MVCNYLPVPHTSQTCVALGKEHIGTFSSDLHLDRDTAETGDATR